ncbi:MAG: hypothetical protein LBE20_03550 [Deltaproteobacteria bacterium]|jgi:hypothetical protein|nr:hypothetical protein [Deltaproteobacteria bacterium]
MTQQQYNNNNRGVLFKNERKQQANHPDYTGSCTINNIEYWISGWIKEKDEKKYFSFSFAPKQQGKNNTQDNKQQALGNTGTSFDNDDIPF